MTLDPQLDRADWIRMHLSRVPDLIEHIRGYRVPSLQAEQGPRISGGGDKARLPLQVDPMDDADALWADVCLVALVLEQRIQERAPVEFDRQRLKLEEGKVFVQGLSTSDPVLIQLQAIRLVGWLKARAAVLALGADYAPAVDRMVKQVREMRGKYPEAPRPTSARFSCPLCGRRAVEAVYSEVGVLLGLKCGHCGASRKV